MMRIRNFRSMSWLGLCVALAVTGGGCRAGSDFDKRFTGKVLRVDYYHAGVADQEHFALHRLRIEGAWPGSRTQTVDPTDLGKYRVELHSDQGELIYRRGFASIYGEWETTREAREGFWRAIQESVRVPEPTGAAVVKIFKRQSDQSFSEVWSLPVDPTSRFVDRSPVAGFHVETVHRGGDSAVKVDLAILGDGYTAVEMEKFHKDARRAADALFAVDPFRSRKSDFNVWAVDTPAKESGITRPRAGAFRESPLGARYNTFDSERYVLSLEEHRWRDAAAAAPYDFVLILVNERKYGGGGIFTLYSTAAMGSSFADYLVVHEFGHHFAGLGDEYYTSSVAYEDTGGERIEPWEPNVTALLDPAKVKWAHRIENGTPLPTPWTKQQYEKASIARQEKRAALRAAGAPEEELEALFREEQELFTDMLGTQEYSGKVGAFEGALYQAEGFYRPETDCIMFTRDEVGFCAVCTDSIERVIDLYSH